MVAPQHLPVEKLVNLSIADALRLGTRDIPTFGRIFFPKTVRQTSPEFHYEMSAELEDPVNRLIAFKVFRDGAKTSLLRLYAAKRIGYCISRTVMVVNISQDKAVHSIRWLKRAVDMNYRYRDAFQLRRGDKWTDTWISIINSQGETVNVVAAGITGGNRGLNIDDFRPDFIICDDISDRENTATDDQRAKANEAFFAQLVRSLAPRSEAPLSQLAFAQTPINSFDLISQAEKDPIFKVVSHSCFRADGQSAWPERRGTDELLKEKQGYINRNQLSTWLAEMECTVVSGETQSLKRQWLKYWQIFPEDGRVAIIVDPASSEEKKADFFAIVVLMFWRQQVYVLDYNLQRGMMPDAAAAKIFEYAIEYKARDLVVETVGYQKILKWYFESQMRERRIWLTVHTFDDKRRKDDRIVQAVTLVAPFGNLLIREGMMELEELFELYGPGYKGKVDLIDALAIGISWNLGKSFGGGADVEGEFRRLREEEESLPNVNDWQGAP
jgi:hypothetical protein